VETQGHGSTAEEVILPRDRAREALLMGLRLHDGIDATWFAHRTGTRLLEAIDPAILAGCLEEAYLTWDGQILAATDSGRRRLDALLPRLVL
jgi:oxygen-independent coproporphyrinogen-3 oxidase